MLREEMTGSNDCVRDGFNNRGAVIVDLLLRLCAANDAIVLPVFAATLVNDIGR
jgi:hypothetical protein